MQYESGKTRTGRAHMLRKIALPQCINHEHSPYRNND